MHAGFTQGLRWARRLGHGFRVWFRAPRLVRPPQGPWVFFFSPQDRSVRPRQGWCFSGAAGIFALGPGRVRTCEPNRSRLVSLFFARFGGLVVWRSRLKISGTMAPYSLKFQFFFPVPARGGGGTGKVGCALPCGRGGKGALLLLLFVVGLNAGERRGGEVPEGTNRLNKRLNLSRS